MRIAHILSKTYMDKCDIYRTQEVKVGNITKQERIKKLENVQCALSQGTSKTTGENVALTTSGHKLFTSYDIAIQKGDEVHVIQNGASKPIMYIANEPFVYHGSHLEVELKRADYE